MIGILELIRHNRDLLRGKKDTRPEFPRGGVQLGPQNQAAGTSLLQGGSVRQNPIYPSEGNFNPQRSLNQFQEGGLVRGLPGIPPSRLRPRPMLPMLYSRFEEMPYLQQVPQQRPMPQYQPIDPWTFDNPYKGV